MIGKIIMGHLLKNLFDIYNIYIYMENVFTQINDIYNKKGFLERYGTDLWISVIIMIIFFIVTSYFYVMNHVKPILANWDNDKCSPSVIPFAGLINKDPKMSVFEFTGKNFTGCIQTILKTIASDAFAPIYYVMKLFIDEFKNFVHSIESIRHIFDKIRITIKTFLQDVMSRLLNITMPIMKFMIVMKDMLSKMNGTLTATTYTLMGAYLSIESLFANIINFIIIILVALSVTIIALLFIPFGIGEAIAIPFIAMMIAITIPTIAIQVFMGDIFKLPTRSTPSIPGCFSGETELVKYVNQPETERGKEIIKIKIKIKDVKVGDILSDSSYVTGVIKFSSKEQYIYKLYDVIVTGEHRVYHDDLGWIKTKDHPDSIEINDYNDPFVYCLITSNKIIKIGKTIYSDWDDIDEDIITKLEKKCSLLPSNFKNIDIHHYLDNGLLGETDIVMNGGTLKNVKNIEINDILKNDVIVLGKVEIDAINLNTIYNYTLKTENNESITIYGKNIELSNASNLEILESHSIKQNEREKINELYQLITNKGGEFEINNNIKIKDYNYGIDKYLL